MNPVFDIPQSLTGRFGVKHRVTQRLAQRAPDQLKSGTGARAHVTN